MSVLIAILFSSFSNADQWAQWRGPSRDGRSPETGLLKQWPEGGPALIWKATGLGSGFSSISISETQIFTTGDKDEACYAHALNMADGKLLWSTRIGKAGAPGWGNFTGPRSTPTVDSERVYVLGQYGELLCLNRANGSKIWEKHLVKDFGGKLPEWGYSESVLIDGENVLCTPGGSNGAIIALNKLTGEVVWRTSGFEDPAHYSSLVSAVIAGVKQYVQLTVDSVVGVSTDGTVLWRAEREGKTAVIPTPVIHGDKVYVTSGYGIGCNLFEIHNSSNGSFEAREVYANKSMANQHGGAILVGDHVYGYCDGSGWVCQDLSTGELKWTEKKKIGKGSLTYADGRLYLRSESGGTVAMIEATPEGYIETGRFVQPGFGKPKTWPHPVVAGKKLYLRDQDLLLCYDIKQP